MITRSQRRCMLYIQEYVKASGGVAPSYEEIRAHLGISNRSGVHRIIHNLSSRGYLRVLPGRWRSIEILKRVEPRVAMFVFDEKTKTLRRL